MIKILQKDNQMLRQTAKMVSIEKIQSSEIKKIIEDMKKAMHQEEDAVAIAAPQIGVTLRIFIVSSAMLLKEVKGDTSDEALEQSSPPDLVFINPNILKKSKRERVLEEGCLSIRWWYGDVSRAQKIKIEAWGENGEKITRGASGLLAQIFQHEIDHLNGVLFTDKAKNLKEIKPEKSLTKE